MPDDTSNTETLEREKLLLEIEELKKKVADSGKGKVFDIKKLSEIFGIVIPPLILFSGIRSYVYYQYWDIPIFDYLSPSELLFSFIQPGLLFIGIAAVYFAAMMVFAGIGLLFVKLKIIPEEKKKSRVDKAKETIKVPVHKKRDKYQIFAWVVFVALIWVLSVWIYVQAIWFDFNKVYAALVHLFLLLIVAGLVHNLSTPKENATPIYSKFSGMFSTIGKLTWNQSILIGIMVTLVSASFFYGRYEWHYTITHPTNYKITLSDSSSIETNENLIYLGKTDNYFFLFDNAKNQSTIIPAKEVKSINIKN